MDEDQIKEAIKKGKLPTSMDEYLILGIFFAILFFTGISPLIFNGGISTSLSNGSILISFIAALILPLAIWGIRRAKRLTTLTSNLPTIKKALVLYNLANGDEVYNVEKENDSYNIYFKAGWLVYAYKATILYDESGYYINSQAQSYNKGFGIRINKTKNVIEKIKELEAQV